jgi:hypothetical protein
MDTGGSFFRKKSVRCEKMNNYFYLVPSLRRLLQAIIFNENVCTLKSDIFLEAGEEY